MLCATGEKKEQKESFERQIKLKESLRSFLPPLSLLAALSFFLLRDQGPNLRPRARSSVEV